MTKSALTIQFTRPSVVREAVFVLLEQEPIDKDINYLTKLQAVDALNYFVSGSGYPKEYCTENVVVKNAYAYPWPADVNYQCSVTKGDISRSGAIAVAIEQTIHCDLSDVLSTSYPVHSITQYEWMTDTYDAEGNEQPKPALILAGSKIAVPYKIFGSVRVVYQTMQDKIQIQIAYNNEVISGATLDPYLICVWPGGHDHLKISFADGEETIDCNNNLKKYALADYDEDDGDPGYISGEDEIHEIDYCTGDELVPE